MASLRYSFAAYGLCAVAIAGPGAPEGEAQTQTPAQLMQSIAETEAMARKQGNLSSTTPNTADIILNQRGAITVRSTSTQEAAALLIAGSGGAPVTVLRPPALKVLFTGDEPDTGFCHFTLPPGGPYLAPAGCNDKVTGIRIPFGLMARICDHDGFAPAPNRFGDCNDFSPGATNVGVLNDRGTTFWVEDRQMYFYFTSASDEVPAGFDAEIEFSRDDEGHTKFGMKFGLNNEWYSKEYRFPLPAWCARPDIWESTKSNDARFRFSIRDAVLTLILEVQPRAPFGATNWIGVGIRCKP